MKDAMDDETPRKRGNTGRWMIGAVAVVIALMALAALTAPVILRSYIDPLSGTMNVLNRIGLQLRMHAAENDGNFPAGLEDLRDFSGIHHFSFRRGSSRPWLYFPGFDWSDRGDTILAASPVTVSEADGTRKVGKGKFRLVLALDGRVNFLTEEDFQTCLAEQQAPGWKKPPETTRPDPWQFLADPVWTSPAPPAERSLPDHEIAALLRTLKQGTDHERWDAADKLAELDDPSPEVIAGLLAALGDSEAGYFAAKGLAVASLSHESIVPELVKALREGEGKTPYWAAVALADVGLDRAPDAIPLMTAALARTGDDIQITAAKALASVGPGTAVAVPELAKLAGHGDGWESKCAIIALGRIGSAAGGAVAALQARLQGNGNYRLDAARSLREIDASHGAELVPLLIRRVESQRNSTGPNHSMGHEFFSALELLGEIGPVASDAIPILRANLKGGARIQAAWSLARIEPELASEMTDIIASVLISAPVPADRLERLFTGWNYLLSSDRTGSGLPADTGLAACGMLWQLHPAKRDALMPVISTILREWKEEKVLNKLDADSRAAIPALETLAMRAPDENARRAAKEALQELRTLAHGQW